MNENMRDTILGVAVIAGVVTCICTGHSKEALGFGFIVFILAMVFS